MKQISKIVKLTALSNVSSVYGNSYVLVNSDKVLKFTSPQEVDFTQSAQTEETGLSYEQEFKAITPDKMGYVMEFNNRKALIILELTDGTERVLGDMDNPCRITVTPNAGRYVIESKRTTLIPIDF